MATTTLGRVAIVPQGAYNAATAYVVLDSVYYNGSSYICIQDGTGKTPSTETLYWQLMAAQGNQDIVDAATAAQAAAALSESAASSSASAAAASALQLAAGLGSPVGPPYADLAALNAAAPSHDYNYLILNNGHWCYWNTATSAFVDSGYVWQAASVVAEMLVLTQSVEKIATENEGNQKLDTGNIVVTPLSVSTKIWTPVILEPNTDYILRNTNATMNAFASIRNHGSTTDLIVISNYTSVPTATGVAFNSGVLSGWYELFLQISIVFDGTSPNANRWMVTTQAVGVIPYEAYATYINIAANAVLPAGVLTTVGNAVIQQMTDEEEGYQKLDTNNIAVTTLTVSTIVRIPVILAPSKDYILRNTNSSVTAYTAIRNPAGSSDLILITNYASVPITGISFNSSALDGWYELFVQISLVFDGTDPNATDWMVTTLADGVVPFEEYTPLYALTDAYTVHDSSIGKNKLKDETYDETFYHRPTVYESAHYGDSLTAGTGSSEVAMRYPNQLNTLIAVSNTGYSFVNRGVGGENSTHIATRGGAYYDYVEPFTIPAATTAVTITKSTTIGVMGLSAGQNPVVIDGIEGTLAYADGGYTFTRFVAGSEHAVTHRTPVIYNSATADVNKRLILWIGSNDVSMVAGLVIDNLVDRIRKMVEVNKTGQYIVVGLTIDYDNRDDCEEKLENAFGVNFLNLRQYLVSYGLSDNSLSPTEADTAALALGNMPPSVLHDGPHFNDYGYYSVAKAVYQRGQLLGYWD